MLAMVKAHPSALTLTLIGDTAQLAPTSSILRPKGIEPSHMGLLQRALGKEHTCFLSIAMRQADAVTAPLLTTLVYGDRGHTLVSGRPNGGDETCNPKWVDVKDATTGGRGSYTNAAEVKACSQLVSQLNLAASEYMVLGFYKSQVEALCREGLNACTVDSAQGHEWPYVMLSLARQEPSGFLGDPTRLLVALSRHQQRLFIVGHRGAVTPSQYQKNRRGRAMWKQIVDTVPVVLPAAATRQDRAPTEHVRPRQRGASDAHAVSSITHKRVRLSQDLHPQDLLPQAASSALASNDDDDDDDE